MEFLSTTDLFVFRWHNDYMRVGDAWPNYMFYSFFFFFNSRILNVIAVPAVIAEDMTVLYSPLLEFSSDDSSYLCLQLSKV